MICEDCEYFHIKNPVGYSKAFCANWKNSVGEIKTVIRKCKYYKKGSVKQNDGY